ncbi:Excinuclease ABC subunit C [Mycolicibacterium tokaiense]|uniref:Excinuclease ABC subunit C n=1 Tax=Mycolicibacterium tokaiense TaxID=39695 RepID=A0A378T8U2_9MYCO|nr:Excinuclease ABC subunit C [Mycolicibacterium tokaiense]
MTHFGSVAKLKQASVEEITAVPGIGVTTATAVLEALGVPVSTESAPPEAEVRDDDSGQRVWG